MSTIRLTVNREMHLVQAGKCCVSDLKEALGIAPLDRMSVVQGDQAHPLGDEVRLNLTSELEFITDTPTDTIQ